ncbi:hypothetical protein [Candidatus Nitrospira bockiana]
MTDAILQAYLEVERAMQKYNEVLEAQVKTLRASEGADASKLERMSHGARAMRDSSMIYLSYAKFIAYGMPESEELVQEDLQG